MVIRIGIADDHAVVRAGLRRYFATQPDLQVVGEAADGHAALALAASGHLDILLVDLAMPGQGGVDVLATIRQRQPTLAVLVLSGFPAADYAALTQRLGARGYLHKSSDPALIASAVRAVATGGSWSSPPKPAGGEADAPHLALPARELQVLLQLAQGRAVSDIADALEVSVRSVGGWRRHVLSRLGLETNSDLTYYALKHGLIQ